jgi:hypothetical protein
MSTFLRLWSGFRAVVSRVRKPGYPTLNCTGTFDLGSDAVPVRSDSVQTGDASEILWLIFGPFEHEHRDGADDPVGLVRI